MIWRHGDRPVDQYTVEERIIRGLWLTGMSWHEARDWLDLHDRAKTAAQVTDLYQRVWRKDGEDEATRPKRRKLLNHWTAGWRAGARAVHFQAVEARDKYWEWWKARYQDELEKPDTPTEPKKKDAPHQQRRLRKWVGTCPCNGAHEKCMNDEENWMPA